MSQDPFEARIGSFDCCIPLEPIDLLALPHGRSRVGDATIDQVAHVKMCVPTTTGMYIDVHEGWHTICIERVEERNIKPSFLASLTERSGPRCFP